MDPKAVPADMRRLWLTLLMIPLLAGCSTISDFFEFNDEEDPQQPAELEDIVTQLDVRKLWSVGVGDGQGDGLYKIQPILVGGTI